MSERGWLVVCRTAKIPGGWRVVKRNLTEEQAERIAAGYQRPHQAMSLQDLLAIRLRALDELRAAGEAKAASDE